MSTQTGSSLNPSYCKNLYCPVMDCIRNQETIPKILVNGIKIKDTNGKFITVRNWEKDCPWTYTDGGRYGY